MRVSTEPKGKPVDIDVLAITSIATSIEVKHRLKIENSRIRPTVPFLRELAEKLGDKIGRQLTPSQAWTIWASAFECLDEIGRKHQTDAELCFWYGINAFELSTPQRIALVANMNRIKAQDTLHNGRYNPADYKAVHQLVLAATGDETQARKARADAVEFAAERATKRR
jgi:hypothetical protein